MQQKLTFTSIFILLGLLLLSNNTFANKTTVSIEAPEKAKKGSKITITIHINHKGNSKAHYTDWVLLKINGEEVKKWIYSRSNLPEDAAFSLEYVIETDKNLEVVAEGNCNKHGSKGEDKFTIMVE